VCTCRLIQIKSYCWFLSSRISLVLTSISYTLLGPIYLAAMLTNSRNPWSMCNHARLIDQQNGNATNWLRLVSFFRSFVDLQPRNIAEYYLTHRNRFRTNLSPHHPQTECDVRTVFLLWRKMNERWSRSRDGLCSAVGESARDVYVITMWCGVKHEDCQDRVYKAGLWDFYYLKWSCATLSFATLRKYAMFQLHFLKYSPFFSLTIILIF